MAKVGVGLVGAGWAVRGMLPGWRAVSDRAEVVAICTTSKATAEAAAAQHGIPRAYASFSEMLEDPDIDIVSMGTPPKTRYDMTLACFDRGRDVFSCIPFAPSITHARALLEAQKRSGRIGMLDAYFLSTPAFRYLKDLIGRGILGDLFAVNIDFSMPLFNKMSSTYPYRWTGYAANGASILRNNAAHAFNVVLGLFGGIDEVIARTALSVKTWVFEDGGSQVPEVPDTATIMMKLSNGALGVMHLGRAVPSGAGFRLEAYGSKARIRAESWHYPHDRTTKLSIATPIRIYEASSERVLETPGEYFHGASDAPQDHPLSITMGRMCAAMLRARDGGEGVEPDFERGLRIQEIVEAAETSERTRSWTRVAVN